MNIISSHLARLSCRGAYVAAWKKVLRASPGTKFHKDWHTILTAEEAKREFSEALDRRINSRGGEDWRNARTEQEISWRRDQRKLQDIRNRIRHYQFESQECRSRFSHLLASHNDY